MKQTAEIAASSQDGTSLLNAVDDEIVSDNQRVYLGTSGKIAAILCVSYTAFHLIVMNFYPLETWVYRLIHVSGGLALGYIFFSAHTLDLGRTSQRGRGALGYCLAIIGGAAVVLATVTLALALMRNDLIATGASADKMVAGFGYPIIIGTALAVIAAWLAPPRTRGRLSVADGVLAMAAITVGTYIIAHAGFLRVRAQVFPHPNDMWAAIAGIILILEMTRRLAGIALVVIVSFFLAYAFVGPWLPGALYHRGYAPERFFAFLYTDNGILGPTTAISSTYLILFITFAAFLQASRVGEYFVSLAFAAAGGARGGPAKVAIFGSGLMGMINGTSAGNVVATGSLTIPMMKRVGYRPQTAAAVEAAASSGGQIMPPIMGAGAFIMAEITGIPYSEIAVAALIPAVLYFLSVYMMVDFAARRMGMEGLPRRELPKLGDLIRRIYLFIPVIILIGALFAGYSVIRAGSYAMVAAAVVSWLTPNWMGPRKILFALEIAARMSLQLVAVCAAAGIIVGVISLTGIGSRFASMLLSIAEANQLLALVFTMCVSVILGMGMPTTAAYAVAASVLAPGLIRLGIDPMTAHFFIFYYAVMSAITPPVALAAYAGAAIARSDPMKTSFESFQIGIAAFVVPFMIYYSPALLMQGEWQEILQVFATALVGVALLSMAVQAWLSGPLSLGQRVVLFAAGIAMIHGSWATDLIGVSVAVFIFAWQRRAINSKVSVDASN
ncbi:TRAP transporter permease [Pararhodobacter oceanensis]|uniref:TRAP transporter permease n=1 Tax=Pararhodobacter oceanensis TaxID=2172121 RepID=UPI003A94BB01